MHTKAVGYLLVLTYLVLGCQPPSRSPIEDLPSLEGLVPDPSRIPEPPSALPTSVSASHILCSYRGALEARRNIRLSRVQARTRAEHLHKLARAKGIDFFELAKKFSDDAKTSLDGGALGTINPGELHPDLERAAFGLRLGQVSMITESPKGFHILFRHAANEAQAAEIVVTYQGAKRYIPRKPRTHKQAQMLADQILQRVRSGSDFEQEAQDHSDLPNHVRGGIYPVFKKGSRHPKLEEIVWSLEVGQLSDVVETETGFHIVKRLPIERIQTRNIFIKYKPQEGKQPTESIRSRSEAHQLAKKIHKRALNPQEDFTALAIEYSDGPEKQQGGLKDIFGRGQLSYDFERAAFSLAPDEISEPLEFHNGFYIIKRIR